MQLKAIAGVLFFAYVTIVSSSPIPPSTEVEARNSLLALASRELEGTLPVAREPIPEPNADPSPEPICRFNCL
ncbi:hypothetical protein E4T56_gene20350 [Termitomyces sp. T112]|nr:hypothetical protein E4T56_gene20350 [Termitomyces sp. T112]KAH0588798.1 hypothetical protein H2248_004598 [Termitomyces sp. 'cryptogamus']